MPHSQFRHIITILLLTLTSLAGTSQAPASLTAGMCTSASPADTTSAVPAARPGIAVMAGGAAMLGTAAVLRQTYPHRFKVNASGDGSGCMADYMQYVTVAAPWALKAAGMPTRSGWGRMAVSQGIASVFMAGAVKGLKETVHSVRPDGTDDGSFPSGHTAIAFMGATMMARELSGESPWYAIGAYTVAAGVAVERALDSHHYPTDIIAGAGIGILSAELGYRLGDLIFGHRQLHVTPDDIRPNSNFSFLSLETGLSLPLGPIRAGDTRLQQLPSLTASLRGGVAMNEHWGIALELGLLSTPLITDVCHDRTFVKTMSSLTALLAAYYMCPLSHRVSFTAEAAGGYRHNLPLNLDDKAVERGTSSPVGRVSAGCVLRFSSRFSARASVGYELSRYRFTVKPSAVYSIPAPASCRGISSALIINVSSRYEF